MKKKIIGILICMMMLSTIPVVAGTTMDVEPKVESKEDPTSLLGVTFLAGFVLNPTESPNGRINANAVALLYYDRGIIKKDSGVVTGLRKVSFKNTQFLIVYEQESLGLARVFGICTGFRIGL